MTPFDHIQQIVFAVVPAGYAVNLAALLALALEAAFIRYMVSE